MVFDSQLTKIYKDHKKLDPTFTFSQTESESREKVSFKLQPLRGLGFVPLSLSSFVLEPLLVENNPPVSTGARTPPSNWDCMTIASKRLLFLDGDHLGLEDCNDENDQVILSKRMLFLDGDHHHSPRSSSPHNPTPRTGTKNRLVPCINSSLLFILVSGSR